MRMILALLCLAAGALPASAQTQPDRYSGGRRAAEAAANGTMRLAAYQGPMLTWANKRLPGPAPEPAPAAAAPRPTRAFQPQAERSAAATAPAPRALPASLYAPPPASAPAPTPAPQKLAQAAPPAPIARRSDEAHFYSIHRPFGLTPDAIPTPPPGERYILVGPPDTRSAPADDAPQDDDKPF